MKPGHFCTYFDRGFLPQGLALWRSMQAHDPEAVLWVLALDNITAEALRHLGGTNLRVVPLAELEAGDPALAAVKPRRPGVDYIFTLSPCLPHWLMQSQPGIDRITYLDADMLFFSNPQPIFDEMGAASVFLTAHRFPGFLRAHYERHGVYNVGVLSWRRDPQGLACLDWWRDSCLDWCHDRVEAGRYADQKYLEEWPRRFTGVVEGRHPGVNLAPWNWMNHRYEFPDGLPRVDGQPLVLFHFARFRAAAVGNRWWQSGQLDYGVMPARLRNSIYGAYWRALSAATGEIRSVGPDWRPQQRGLRLNRDFWRELPLRLVFGSDWLRLGDRFVSGRLGAGRYSGRVLARLRTIFLRT
jgi:hypothetical protein